MSSIAEVRDIDCVVSLSPLRFDLTAREVTGAAAILRRILYRWCSRKTSVRHAPGLGLVTPLADLDGAAFDQGRLDGLRAALLREALDEDFVKSAEVTLTVLASGTLVVAGAVTLVDGRTYPLEVLASAASAALLTIGGST